MNTPKKFRKKPVVIEAIRYTPHDNCGAVSAFMGIPEAEEACDETENDEYGISTLEGVIWAQPGDWIIKGVQGEFYPVKDAIFTETYEPVGDADVTRTERNEQ